MMDVKALKEAHDELLSTKPEKAYHDISKCVFCQETASSGEQEIAPKEVNVSTYTEEEVQAKIDAAVQTAVAGLQAKIDGFEVSSAQAEFDSKLAEIETANTATVNELKGQIDTLTLELEAAAKQNTDVEAYLAEVASQQELEAETARLRDERLAVVKEVASFPEAYVEGNADRWASMAAEDFESLVNDWKAIGHKVENSNTEIPTATAAIAARTEGGKSRSQEAFDLALTGPGFNNL